jgi:spore maturation protein CgeB
VKIVIFGLSISSAWGNGHATTFRALCRGLHQRGHKIVFFEQDTEWYRNNRDLPNPDFVDVRYFEQWSEALPAARRELDEADIAMVGSYFPHGVKALELAGESRCPAVTFYDVDTPITMSTLRSGADADYITRRLLREIDVYFSFTGGPVLRELESRFGVKKAVPLYCSFDPQRYRRLPVNPEFACELSYMGTYAPDRQPKVNELLCKPAKALPESKFIVAGPQYPDAVNWPANVQRIIHLNPAHHPAFYSSSKLTLNVTRREMVMSGYSPSVRLFEAAACGASIVSDNWPGLDTFFTPGEEILLPSCADDVIRYVREARDGGLGEIGRRAQERVLAEHTNEVRAREFEAAIEQSAAPAVQTGSPAFAD